MRSASGPCAAKACGLSLRSTPGMRQKVSATRPTARQLLCSRSNGTSSSSAMLGMTSVPAGPTALRSASIRLCAAGSRPSTARYVPEGRRRGARPGLAAVREALQLQHTARQRAVKLPPLPACSESERSHAFQTVAFDSGSPDSDRSLLGGVQSLERARKRRRQGHGPCGGMPPARGHRDDRRRAQTLPVDLRVRRPDRRLARGRGARARHRHPADAQLQGRRRGRRRASRCSPSTRRRSRPRWRAPRPTSPPPRRASTQAKRNAARLKPLYAEKAVSQKEYDDAVSAEAIGAADVKARAGAAHRGAAQPRATRRSRRRSSGIAEPRACARKARWSPGPSVLLTTRDAGRPDLGATSASRTTSSSRLQKEVAGRPPRRCRRTAASRSSCASPTARCTRSTGTPQLLRRARLDRRPARARCAPSCRTRTARCARASSCAWCCKGATRPNAVAVPQRAVLEGPQGKFVYVVERRRASAEPRPVRSASGPGERLDRHLGAEGAATR